MSGITGKGQKAMHFLCPERIFVLPSCPSCCFTAAESGHFVLAVSRLEVGFCVCYLL